MNKDSFNETTNKLSELLVNSPTRSGAKEMCEHMEKLYVAAIAGLFTHAVGNQATLDRSYELVDDVTKNLRSQLHDVLHIIATKLELEGRGMTDVNLQTHLEIMKELDDDLGN